MEDMQPVSVIVIYDTYISKDTDMEALRDKVAEHFDDNDTDFSVNIEPSGGQDDEEEVPEEEVLFRLKDTIVTTGYELRSEWKRN